LEYRGGSGTNIDAFTISGVLSDRGAVGSVDNHGVTLRLLMMSARLLGIVGLDSVFNSPVSDLLNSD